MTQRWLAFDTSTDVLSIGVGVGDQLMLRTQAGGAQASASLIPAAMDMLAQAGVTLAQLDAIVFGRGPGSFTGLRTACAVAQGLAFGADIAVLPVDTLLALAEEARVQVGAQGAALTVLALLDARMDEVYSAAYQWDGGMKGGVWQTQAALQVGPPERVMLPTGDAVLLAGNAFEAYGERLPTARRVQALPTAAALLRLAPGLMAAGQAVPAEQAMPLYIRDKVAQTTAEREAAKAAKAGGA
jgi:tRNA threonylcarbamoyladenosine biosynthesis protein TsaB